MAVKQTFTGDASKLTAEIDKVNRAYAKMEEKLQRLTDESKKSERAGQEHADSLSSSATAGVTKLAGLVAGWMSVSKAIGTVNDVLAKQAESQQRNLDLNLQLSVQQQNLLLNTGADFAPFIPQIQDIQRETGVNVSALTGAASYAISSRSGLSAEEAMKTMRASAKLSPNIPQDIEAFTQVALNIQNAAGGDLTAEQALGFVQSAATRAGTAEPALFFQNVLPVAHAAAVADPTDKRRGIKEAVSMMTMLTGQGDPGATLSSSAVANFIPRLAEFMTEQTQIQDPVSFFGRVQALQEDETLKTTFLESGGMKGRLPGRLRGQVQNMLTAGTPQAEELLSIAGDISFTRDAYDERVSRMASTGPLSLAARERQSVAAEQEYVAGTMDVGAAGLARQAVRRGLGAGADGGFISGMASFFNQMDYTKSLIPQYGPIEGGIIALQGRRGTLSLGGVSENEKPEYDILTRQLDVLLGLRDDVRQAQGQAMAGAANEQPGRHAEN